MPEPKNTPLTPELYAYVLAQNPPLDPALEALADVTREHFPEAAGMLSAPEQAPLLAFLVRLTGARQVVEVGTFTGFATLAMAQALPADGTVLTCDVSEEWTAYGREAWAAAGVADRIRLRLGPALETLRGLPPEPHLDLVYLDADKGGYIGYWEELVPRLRPGGLLVADNVLYHGEVTDPAASGPALAIREFNDHVRRDPRTEAVLVTVADGVTLARRR
ncbi:SAM-dependent methyltransferase [Streptomyces sp. NRRL F-4489]|uniref:O-methyltransferase n=1 Tax=Streptomyces sp. NRRL F-4489 TaxID=1609095 RepID=UPI0007470684|nr:O-methyltransferase [Streptomyces sp. NRRL F-4489]KUL35685.1 SAM-dependent methyltransferase [Streptomyces sp. NRRL F-4489]